MRILVCGGRDFRDWSLLWNTLDELADEWLNYIEVIHGDAAGADQGADIWCWCNDLIPTRYPADWKKHKYAAGPIRNKRMLEEGKPDLVIAFPGGKGTANMVKLAKEAGVEVREIS